MPKRQTELRNGTEKPERLAEELSAGFANHALHVFVIYLVYLLFD
jgi:hypothetical protein